MRLFARPLHAGAPRGKAGAMVGVIAIGECMVELALTGDVSAIVGYAGDTFNTAVYLRRLGRPTAYATALGHEDPFSQGILGLMIRETLATDLIVEAKGRLPGLYAIQRDEKGERRFFYWRGEAPAREYFELADLGMVEAAMLQAELIYLSAITLAVIGETGRDALLPLLAKAARAGAGIAFDTNYRTRLWPDAAAGRAAIEAVAPHCRYLSLAEDDVSAFGGAADALAKGWAEMGAEVVLRWQDRTVQVYSGASVETFAPPPPLPVMDTTGAGDSFNAAYLDARMAGRTIRVAVAAGRRLASVVVRHPGAIIPLAAMPRPL
jgi:2-dehydro-3-deoxygluconokinase